MNELEFLRQLEIQVRCYAWNPRRGLSRNEEREFDKLLGDIDAARQAERAVLRKGTNNDSENR